MSEPRLKIVNPDDPPAPLGAAEREAIAALAARQARAKGLLMRAVNVVSSSVEDGLRMLPAPLRARLDRAAAGALLRSYHAAERTRSLDGRLGAIAGRVAGDRAHKALAAASGALGGLGGLPTALVELPVATTIIFRAVQGVAEAHGEDPASAATRAECLRASGAVPVIGAAAGAGTNWAFIAYYVEIAHVHFGLRRLARAHGEEAVQEEFLRALVALNPARPPVKRA